MHDSFPSHSNVPTRSGLEAISLLAGGQTIGRFRLVQLLGEGGMGSVWLAEDPTRKDDVRDGRVVLKFLRDDIRRCPEAVEQFRSSYRKVQQLFHEHICPLLDLGDDDRFGAFQVMPFVKGMTLLELLKKEDPEKKGLPPERVVAILQPVAKALDYAHREGLIHRDIKPGNIMVDPETGKVSVVDFGLAAEVRTSMSMHSRSTMQVSGTEPYMAPEQWRGQAQDGRSDQYSLAVVAWQMLTGTLPYLGSGMQLGFAVTQGPIPELDSTLQPMQAAFSTALCKNRKERFVDCQSFLEAIVASTSVYTEPLRPTWEPVADQEPEPPKQIDSGKPIPPDSCSPTLSPKTAELTRRLFDEATSAIRRGGSSRPVLQRRTAVELRFIEQEAEAGNPEAQWLLGDCYLEGIAGRLDDSRARHWFQQASSAGLPWAHVTLGSLWLKGIGGERDTVAGIELLRKAISQGSPEAAHRLAIYFLENEGKTGKPKAKPLLEFGIEKEHPGAVYSFASNFLPNDEEASEYLRMIEKSAFAGYARAKIVLANSLLEKGQQTADGNSIQRAIQLLREAAEQDCIEAVSILEQRGIVEHRRSIQTAGGSEMVLIPAGRFNMGTPEHQVSRNDCLEEKPSHSVLISKDFWLSKTVVTQAQYKTIMGKNPSRHKWSLFDKGRRPVESVTWLNAIEYCNSLSRKERLTPFYGVEKDRVSIIGGNGYRLPTEAEWEYACRARTGSAWFWGNEESEASKHGAMAIDLITASTPLVAQHLPNRFGLYDMLGGVWEWCWDRFSEEYYSESLSIDPNGPDLGECRVVRGGSYWEVPFGCRSAVRRGYDPKKRDQDLGFRIARSI